MKRALVVAALMIGSLTACGEISTCYGTEPDGEVEKLRPCPSGWKNGEHRSIGEDQFKHLEVTDLKAVKDRKKGL